MSEAANQPKSDAPEETLVSLSRLVASADDGAESDTTETNNVLSVLADLLDRLHGQAPSGTTLPPPATALARIADHHQHSFGRSLATYLEQLGDASQAGHLLLYREAVRCWAGDKREELSPDRLLSQSPGPFKKSKALETYTNLHRNFTADLVSQEIDKVYVSLRDDS